ncbi:phosphatidylserine decarboxylase family protein [Candidatus Sulfidibacterium hydrothermale]|uniref:phosphatidylserine decarboxylase family protein n=1 Tax=Candidatus Sulfidibacterium hydrothermale TaxID=2875962 RepID=UPI001F0A9274|nr:phosphatidylserine decarboxylase family protein [Candidatus Sulfidibacterium hydrothermale]UBM63452.1 phosphatidylserine decarboxylase family protein [Candidatus Sulfidibacterium hydrothermale]
MKFHKEGYKIIRNAFFVVGAIIAVLAYLPIAPVAKNILIAFFALIFAWIVFFFRVPRRKTNAGEHILSSADGTIVAIEEVFEAEYFKEKRLQISVFMSGFDVHVNWYPFDGTIRYTKYHEGKYLLARHPKSSEENERSSIVLEKEKGKDVLIRQVAGIMARRIVYYSKVGQKVKQGEEIGMIRFGSRVDFFLPVTARPVVKIGDRVWAKRTIVAYFS